MTDVVAPRRRRPRTALWVSLAIAVVMVALVVVLATRDSASSRIVKSPLVGKGVPALVGTTIDGAAYDIDDQRGRWSLVNFFATWCTPCIEEHDDLVQLHESGAAEVVSVVFSDDEDAARRFFADRGGDWPVVPDGDGAVATDFGVARVPESYLVGPDGVVYAKVTGGVTAEFVRQQIERFSS